MTDSFERICMIGLGYIGLPTAAVIASRGKSVVGVDVNPATVDTINAGNIHIVEPDLDIVVRSAVTTGHLRATGTPEPADAFFIAVPTPFTDGHKPDLGYIDAAARSIAPMLESGNLVVLESTVPVGTTEFLASTLAEQRPDLTFDESEGKDADVDIAHCPERVLPGQVLQELVNNDRIIGGLSRKAACRATVLYKTFVKGDCLITSARAAELSKLTENAYRDVNIAFANEMSLICDELNVDIWELIGLANRHPRVNILQPGPGVGGHCIAVDPWFIVDSARDNARLIRVAREVNDHKPKYVLSRIRAKASRFKKPVIACFGLAFKANIDDLRESPAMQIVCELAKEENLQLIVVEPNISRLPVSLAHLENVTIDSASSALEWADIVVGLVDHIEFLEIGNERLKEKIVIDTRGMWR